MHVLLESVVVGDFDKVKEILDSGIWPGTTDSKGNTGLHLASVHGYPEIGQLFIDSGVFVNRTNYQGEQSLHLAAMAHQPQVVDMLMQNGAAILAVDFLGNTPLHYAVQNQPDTGFVDQIIQYGAQINTTNKANETALDLVQSQINVELLSLLVKNGATAPYINDLLSGALTGDEDVVQTAIDNGEWPGAVGPNGLTGLHYATALGYPEIAQAFIDAGVFVNRTTYEGEQPLHLAAQHQQLELIDLLLDNGAAILAVDYQGNTPLHYAVESDASLDVVQRLIDAGGDVNAVNNADESVLDWATAAGNSGVISLLIDNGAMVKMALPSDPILHEMVLSDSAVKNVDNDEDSPILLAEVLPTGTEAFTSDLVLSSYYLQQNQSLELTDMSTNEIV